jgi:hypothetical protein
MYFTAYGNVDKTAAHWVKGNGLVIIYRTSTDKKGEGKRRVHGEEKRVISEELSPSAYDDSKL